MKDALFYLFVKIICVVGDWIGLIICIDFVVISSEYLIEFEFNLLFQGYLSILLWLNSDEYIINFFNWVSIYSIIIVIIACIIIIIACIIIVWLGLLLLFF